MSQQNFATPLSAEQLASYVQTWSPSEALNRAAERAQQIADWRQANPPQVDYDIAALAEVSPLSSDQKQALNQDTYDYIYNRQAFEDKHGPNARAKTADEVAKRLSQDQFVWDNRTGKETASDIALGVAQGTGQMALGVAALGAKIFGDDASLAVARAGNAFTEWSDQFGSNYRKASKKAMAAREIGRDAIRELQWKADKDAGDSDFMAGLKQVGRDFVQGAQDWVNDPNAVEQSVTNAIGSLVLAGPMSKGVGFVGKALSKTGKTGLLAQAGKALSQNPKASFAAHVLGNEGITNAIMETGGSIQGAVAAIDAMSTDELMSNPQFVEQVRALMASGMSEETAIQQAKDDLAKGVANWAALVTTPIAMVTGGIAHNVVRNPFDLKSWTPTSKAMMELAHRSGEEALEEGLQGFQKMGENLGMQQAGFNKHLWEGVGTDIIQGALAGGIAGGAGPIIGGIARTVTAAPVAIGSAVYENSNMGRQHAIKQNLADYAEIQKQINDDPSLTPEEKKDMLQSFHDILIDKLPQESYNNIREQLKSDEVKNHYDSSKTILQNQQDFLKKAKKLEKKDPEQAKMIYEDVLRLQNLAMARETPIKGWINQALDILHGSSLITKKEEPTTDIAKRQKQLVEALQIADPQERLNKIKETLADNTLTQNANESTEAFNARVNATKDSTAQSYENIWNYLTQKRANMKNQSLIDRADSLVPKLTALRDTHSNMDYIRQSTFLKAKKRIAELTPRIERLKAKQQQPESELPSSQPIVEKGNPDPAKVGGSPIQPVQMHDNPGQIQKFIDNPDVPLSWDSDSYKADEKTYATGLSSDGKYVSFMAGNNWNAIPVEAFKKAKQEAQAKKQQEQSTQQPEPEKSTNETAASTENKEQQTQPESKEKQSQTENSSIEVIKEKPDSSKPAGSIQNPHPVKNDIQEQKLKTLVQQNAKVKQFESDPDHILVEENGEWHQYSTSIYNEVLAQENESTLYRETTAADLIKDEQIKRNPTTKALESTDKNIKEFVDDWQNKIVVVVDVETTAPEQTNPDEAINLNAKNVEILHFSAKKYDNGKLVDEFNVHIAQDLSNPNLIHTIPKEIDGQKNPILDLRAKNPLVSYKDAYTAFIKFVGDASLVGHNAIAFDIPAIENNAQEKMKGMDIPSLDKNKVYDTMYLTRKAFPTRSNLAGQLKLSTLQQEFNLSTENKHTADSDVSTTAELIQVIVDRYTLDKTESDLSNYIPSKNPSREDLLIQNLVQEAKDETPSVYSFEYDSAAQQIIVTKGDTVAYYISLNPSVSYYGYIFEADEAQMYPVITLNNNQEKYLRVVLPILEKKLKGQIKIVEDKPEEIPEILKKGAGSLSLFPTQTSNAPVYVKTRRNNETCILNSTKSVLFTKTLKNGWVDNRNPANPLKKITNPDEIAWLNALADHLQGVKPRQAINFNPDNYAEVKEYADGIVEIIDQSGKVILEKTKNGTWYAYLSNEPFPQPVGENLHNKVEEFYLKLIDLPSVHRDILNTTKEGTAATRGLDFSNKNLSIQYGAYNSLIITDRTTGKMYRLSSVFGLPSYQWQYQYITKKGEEKWGKCSPAVSQKLTQELMKRLLNLAPEDMVSLFLTSEDTSIEEQISLLQNFYDGLTYEIREPDLSKESEKGLQNTQIISIYPVGKDPSTDSIVTVTYSSKQKAVWDFSKVLDDNTDPKTFAAAQALFGNILHSLFGSEMQGQVSRQHKLLSPERVQEESTIKQGTYVHNITPGSLYQYLSDYISSSTASNEHYQDFLKYLFWLDQFSHNVEDFTNRFQEILFKAGIQIIHSTNKEDIASIIHAALIDTENSLHNKETTTLADSLTSVKNGSIQVAEKIDLKNMNEEVFFELMQNTTLGLILDRADLATFNTLYETFKRIAQESQTLSFNNIEAFYAELDRIVAKVLKETSVKKIQPGQSMFTEMVSLTDSELMTDATPEVVKAVNHLFDVDSKDRNQNNLLNYFDDPIDSLFQFFDYLTSGQISETDFIKMFSIGSAESTQDANIRVKALYDDLSTENFKLAKAFRTFFNQRSHRSLLKKLLNQLQSDFINARNANESEFLDNALSGTNGSGIIAAIDKAHKLNNANSISLFLTKDKNGNLAWNDKLMAKVALAALASYFKLAKIANGVHDNNSHQETLRHHVDESQTVVDAVINAASDLHVETVFSVFEAIKADIKAYMDLHPSKNLPHEQYDNIINTVTATVMQSMANMGLFTVVQAEYQGTSDKDINFTKVTVFRNHLDGSKTVSDPIVSGTVYKAEEGQAKKPYKTQIFIKVNSATEQRSQENSYEDLELTAMAGEIQKNASYMLNNLLLGLDQSGVFTSYEELEEHQKERNDRYKHSPDKLTEEQEKERKYLESQPSQVNLPFFGLVRILNQDMETIHAIADYLGNDFYDSEYGVATNKYLASQKGKWISLITSFRNLEAIFRRIKANSENSKDHKLLSEYRLYNAYMVNIMGRFSMEEGAQAQQDKCWRQMFPVALRKTGDIPAIDLNDSLDFENFIRAICQGIGVKVPRVLRGNEVFLYNELDKQLRNNDEHLFKTKAWEDFCKLVDTFPNDKTPGIDFTSKDPQAKETVLALLKELKKYGLTKSWLALDNLTEIARLSNAYAKRNGEAFTSFAELGSFYGQDLAGVSYSWVSNQVIENDGMNSGFSHIAHTLLPTVGNLTLQMLNVWHATGMGFAIPGAVTGSAANTLAQGSFDQAQIIGEQFDADIASKLYTSANDGYQMVAHGVENIMNNALNYNIFAYGHWPISIGGQRFTTIARDLNGKRDFIQVTPNYLAHKVVSLIAKLDDGYTFTKDALASLSISRNATKYPTMWFQYGAGLDTSAIKIVDQLIQSYHEKITAYNRLVSSKNYKKGDPTVHEMYEELVEIARLMQEVSLLHITSRDAQNNISTVQNKAAQDIRNYLPEVNEGEIIPSSFDIKAHDARILKDNFKFLLVQSITDYMNKDLFGDDSIVKNKNAIVSAAQVLNSMYEAMQMAWIKKLLRDVPLEGAIQSDQLTRIQQRIKEFLPTLENKLKLKDHENNTITLHKKLVTMRNTMLRTLIDEHYFDFLSEKDKRNLENGRGLFQGRNETLMPSLHGIMNIPVRTGGGVAILIQAIQGLAEANIISAMTESNPGLSFQDFYDGINFRLDKNTVKGTQLSNKYCYEIWTKLNIFESIKDMLERFNKNLLDPSAEHDLNIQLASSLFSNCLTDKVTKKNSNEEIIVPKLNGIQQTMRDALYSLAIVSKTIPETMSQDEFTKKIFSFQGDIFKNQFQPDLFQKIMLNAQYFFAQQARNQAIQNRAVRGIYPLIIDQLAGLGIGYISETEPLPDEIAKSIENDVTTLTTLMSQGQYKAANELYIQIYNKVTTQLLNDPDYAISKYFTNNSNLFKTFISDYSGQSLVFTDVVKATFAPLEAERYSSNEEQMSQVLHPENRASAPKIISLGDAVSKWAKEMPKDSLNRSILKSLMNFLYQLAMIPSIANKYRIIELDKKLFHNLSKEEQEKQINELVEKQFPGLSESDPASFKQITNSLLKVYSNATRLAEVGGMYQTFTNGGVIFVFTDSEAADPEAENRRKIITTIHEIIHAFTADFFDQAISVVEVQTGDQKQRVLRVNKDKFKGKNGLDMQAYLIVSHLVDVFNSQMAELQDILTNDPSALDHAPVLRNLVHAFNDPKRSIKTCFKEFVAYALSEEQAMKVLANKQIVEEELGVYKTLDYLYNHRNDSNSNTAWWTKFKNTIIGFAKDVRKLIKRQLRHLLGSNADKILNDKRNINVLNDVFWSLQSLFSTEAYTEYATQPITSNQTLFSDGVETRSLDQQGRERSPGKDQQVKKQLKAGFSEKARELAEKAMLSHNFKDKNLTILQSVARVFNMTADQIDKYNTILSAFMRTYYLDRSQLKPFSEIQFKFFESLKNNNAFVLSKDPTQEELAASTAKVQLFRALQKEGINFPDLHEDLQISYAMPVLLALIESSPEMQQYVNSIAWHTPKEHEINNPNDWIRNKGYQLHNTLHDIELGLPSKNPTVLEVYQYRRKILDNMFAANQQSVFDHLGSPINSSFNYLEDKLQTFILSTLEKASQNLNDRNIILSSAIIPLLNIPHDVPKTLMRKSLYFSNRVPKWVAEIGTDFLGFVKGDITFYEFRKSLKHKVDYTRQHYRTNMPKELRKMFGKRISKHMWESLYRSLARTGIGTLVALDPSKVNSIPSLLKPQNAAIAQLESSINHPQINHLIKAQILKKAKQAAHYMITGEAGSYLLKSSFAILEEYHVHDLISEETIDKLISLYALQELSDKDKQNLLSMMKNYEEPMKRLINYMASLHNQEREKIAKLENDLKENPNNPLVLQAYYRAKMNAFQNFIPVHRTDGTSMIVASDTRKDELERLGFQRVGDFNNKFTKNLGYYYSPIPQQAEFMEGMFIITSPSYQGAYLNTGRSVQGVSHSNCITDPAVVDKITRQLKDGTIDSQTADNLIPVFGGTHSPKVIAYEYALNPTQANFIENKFELPEMLGILHGRQVEEEIAGQINQAAAKLVVDSFDPKEINLCIDLLDPNLNPVQKDAISRIPYDILQDMKEGFAERGFDGHIYVRKDLFIDIIGERKISIAEAFNPNSSDMNRTMLKTIATVLTVMFGKNAMKYAVYGERAIQGAVSWAKSTIVVRSCQVCILNMAANIFHLMTSGVPLKVILKEVPFLLDECETYVKNQKKIRRLEMQALSAFSEKEAEYHRSQIQALEDANKQLAIYDIIDEFSMINDLGRSSEEIALSKGKLGEWIQDKVDKLPDSIVATGNFFLLAKDTPIFEALEKATQYGDFIAKALLYRHWIRTGQKSPGEARARVLYEFVDYDKNAGRAREYLENMGLMWFMKYKLRIMRVAETLLKEHPLRAALTILLPNPVPFVGEAGDVFSDSILGKICQGMGMSSLGLQMFMQAFKLHPLALLF